MKKLFLLAALIVAINLSTFAQSIVVSPTTVESGSLITLTGTGETSANRILNIQYDYFSTSTSSPGSNYQAYISVTNGTETQSFNPGVGTPIPTKYTFKVANSYSSAITVSIGFTCSLAGGSQVSRNVTVTINPVPPQTVTYYNVVKSGTFTKNDCGSGLVGSSVTYTVPANTASCNSTISQADADAKAQNLVNTNGQAYANSNGTCSPPPPTITGELKICANGVDYTYTINNLPSGVTVTAWSTMFDMIITSSTATTVLAHHNQTQPISSGAKGKIVASLSDGSTVSTDLIRFKECIE